uniref:Uncharacterized protein n=1 Tax=Rhizophora mucronata TaxID=61149 RepID=A0A2P2J7R4_RHIMU
MFSLRGCLTFSPLFHFDSSWGLDKGTVLGGYWWGKFSFMGFARIVKILTFVVGSISLAKV